MESTNKPSDAPEHSLDTHCGSRLLLLPKELRLEIYRHVLVNPSGSICRDGRATPVIPVLIMNKDHDVGDTSTLNSATKYACTRDLRILQTNKQVREEAGYEFYHANMFTLYLYMPYDAQSRSDLFVGLFNYVDLRRIRQCRISSAPWRYPRSQYDSKEESVLWEHFAQFAKALSGLPGHQMQDLLIECYHFEVATVGERRALFSLEYMIEDLKLVRGIKHVHIRALNPEVWPYLRELERLMMSNETSESKLEDIDTTSLGKIAIAETHASPESGASEHFRRFGAPPLYHNIGFVHSP